MTDVIVSEWWKLRSVRSTYYLFGTIMLTLLVGSLVSVLMVADWDGSSAPDRAHFATADPGVFTIPMTQFCVAALGGLVITGEYGTGMIRTSLVSVPRRGSLLTGKAVVVALGGLFAGMLAAFGSLFAGEWITGDRPPPIAAWESTSDGVLPAVGSGVAVMVAGLVGLGLGVLIRSTAGVLISVGALLFVLPSLVYFLPESWGTAVGAVLPTNLAPQLAGTAPEAVLTPAGAGAVLAAYVLVALSAAAVVLHRRDA